MNKIYNKIINMNKKYNIFLIIIFLIIIFSIFSKQEEEDFSDDIDCLVKKELASLIDPNKIGTDEEDFEYDILLQSEEFKQNEINNLKKYLRENHNKIGFKNSIDNYFKC